MLVEAGRSVTFIMNPVLTVARPRSRKITK